MDEAGKFVNTYLNENRSQTLKNVKTGRPISLEEMKEKIGPLLEQLWIAVNEDNGLGLGNKKWSDHIKLFTEAARREFGEPRTVFPDNKGGGAAAAAAAAGVPKEDVPEWTRGFTTAMNAIPPLSPLSHVAATLSGPPAAAGGRSELFGHNIWHLTHGVPPAEGHGPSAAAGAAPAPAEGHGPSATAGAARASAGGSAPAPKKPAKGRTTRRRRLRRRRDSRRHSTYGKYS